MKRRFNKLLAVVLSAAMCLPIMPADTVKAENPDVNKIVWTEPENISVTPINEDDRFSNFNKGWKFFLGDSETAKNKDFIDSSWTDVDLPHDFSISQNFTSSGEAESGFLPGGIGWYRKKFTLPESFTSKSVILNFDGIYSDAYVYINGTQVGEHHYGYTSFSFNISEYLICDNKTENVIAVKAVNDIPTSRWYSGSGIYRDVTLIVADPVHVDVNGTAVTTPNIKDGIGTVKVTADIVNDSSSDINVMIRNTVYAGKSENANSNLTAVSNTVTQNISIEKGSSVISDTDDELVVNDPETWSIETPENMYFVRTEVLINNKVVDTYDSDFGFRWYEFDDETGFSLNGKNIKLNGVCLHHDQGALGSAAYYDAIYRQLSIMQDMGVNAIRITHNPGAKNFIEICNDLGLLVIEEFFDGWILPKNGNRNDFAKYFKTPIEEDNHVLGGSSDMTWAEFTLKSTVKRDRNQPSLILWSLGNEVQEGTSGATEEYITTAENLIQWTKEEDPSRMVTNGSNDRGTSGYIFEVCKRVDAAGIAGYNYANNNQLTTLSNEFGCIISSETASHTNSRGMYKTKRSGDNSNACREDYIQYGRHLTSYDTSCVSWGKTAQQSMWDTMQLDFIAGQFVWTGFDYIGEPTPWNGTGTGDGGRGAIPNSSYFGIVETSGFPKDNYYLYRSQWNQKENDPTLHLVTAWDSNNMMYSSGTKTPVCIYSNAPEIKLYRNNELIGTATRTVHTSPAGHKYYTYAAKTENSSICTPVNGSNAASQYAAFDVEYASGTISAKAYDGDKEITEQCVGNTSVSTPGEADKLIATSNKKSIDANGYSLAYITVDVMDNKDNLITTAENEITFNLTGDGEIVGVDNGDQATVNKYQQKSVLENSKTAKIKAYAGKALVIVRSTEKRGSFTVTAASDSLTSDSVTVQTKTDSTSENIQIESYTMARHCYVPIGSKELGSLPASVTAMNTDGTTRTLNINWNNDYDKSKLNKRGSFQITGTITNSDVKQTITPYIVVHVYDKIAAVQNQSLCTAPNTMPVLPKTAMAYYLDGTPFEEFSVNWNIENISKENFVNIGDVVSISGTVSVLGTDYPITAAVRVASPIISYSNVAPAREHLADNGYENGSTTNESGEKTYSDNLFSLTDNNKTDTGDASSRWSDYDNRNVSTRQDNLQIALNWATVTSTDRIDIYYYKKGTLPDSVKFEYASDYSYDETKKMIESTSWTPINYSVTDVEGFESSTTIGKSYQLESMINPYAIRITFGHVANVFMALNEIEVMSPDYSYNLNSSAALTSVSSGTKTVTFNDQDIIYYMDADSIDTQNLDIVNPENASVTLLQKSDALVRIIAVSEDGSETKTYVVTTDSAEMPTEESKEALDKKIEASSAIDSSLQSLDSYKTLLQIIEETKNKMDTMTESDLTDNFTALENAYKNIYKEAIHEKIASYKTLNSNLYTPESYKALQTLISQTESQMDTMSESQLQKRLADLSNFKLVAANNKDPKPTLTTADKITVANVEYQVLDPAKKTVAAVRLTNKNASKITIQNAVTIKTVSCNVVQINANVFKGAKKLKTVKLGKYVTNIGKGAFANCKKLKTVTFQATAVTISKGAFKNAKSGVTVKGTKKLKGKQLNAFKKKLKKAGLKNPKLR